MEILVRRAVWILVALTASASFARQPSAVPNEAQVRAAFLYNFLKFIEWPASGKQGLVIGVVSNPEFAKVLEETVGSKTVDGTPVTTRRLASLAEAHDCNIVFVAGPQTSVPLLPGVLTVGDDPDFLAAGGIVRFFLDDSRVRFQIQPERAKASGLQISARLLSVAVIR